MAFVLALPAVASASQALIVKKGGSGSGSVTSSPTGIECGSTCSASFADGSTVTLTGTPGAISQPVQWTGCTSVSAENKCEVTMSAAKSVTATFNLVKHQLTVSKLGTGTGTVISKPAGIECGPTCSVNFTEGAVVTLTGSPAAGGLPVQWTGCDSVDLEGKCLVTMKEARAVTATFDLPSFQLAVTKGGSSSGTVTSSPAGIECGGSCTDNFVKGAKVALTGLSGPHAEAVKWTGCDTVTKENLCLVAMSEARSVTATFELDPQWIEYTLSVRLKGTGKGTVTSSPGGIECGEDCAETYVNRTPVTLVATPASGSVFVRWSGGSCSGTGTCRKSINSTRTVNAVFAATGTRTLSVSKAGAGSGTVTSKRGGIDCGSTCQSEIDASTRVSLEAAPAPGSTFAGWSGACAGAKVCKVTMNEARNVTATFTKATPPVQCVVPNLRGKTLAKARAALQAAHCALGKVHKPKGAKASKLRVKASSPGAGSVLAAGSKVGVRLAVKR